MELLTARLRGERMTAAHYDVVAAFQRDEAYMTYLGGPRRDAQIDELFERDLVHWDAFGFGMWVLHEHDGYAVGIAGIRHVDNNQDSDVGLGYGFAQHLWGRGLATEVGSAVVDVARDTLGLRSMIARAHAEHAASIGVMKKLGFLFECDLEEDGVHGVQYRLTIA